MTYELSVEAKDGVLRVVAAGPRTLESILAISREVLQACAELRIGSVLADIRPLEGHLSTLGAYQLGAHRFTEMREERVVSRLAILDREELADRHAFLETVTANRGMQIRVFYDPEDALAWLG